jgi:hypothetical protein
MQAEMESGRFAVVPGDNAAEPLLPLDLTAGVNAGRKVRRVAVENRSTCLLFTARCGNECTREIRVGDNRRRAL